jgi:hypothetical protein
VAKSKSRRSDFIADIKTRDAVKGTIKTLDKAAVAGERMKSVYAKTKDKAEQGYYAEENSPTEFAADKVSHASGRIKDEGIHQFNKQGQKNAQITRENIGNAKDKIADFKAKRAKKAAEQKTMRNKAEQNAADGGKLADKDQTAGKADNQDDRQKCGKNRQDHSKRDGQGDGKRRENRKGDSRSKSKFL